jgi:hypothetical protein
MGFFDYFRRSPLEEEDYLLYKQPIETYTDKMEVAIRPPNFMRKNASFIYKLEQIKSYIVIKDETRPSILAGSCIIRFHNDSSFNDISKALFIGLNQSYSIYINEAFYKLLHHKDNTNNEISERELRNLLFSANSFIKIAEPIELKKHDKNRFKEIKEQYGGQRSAKSRSSVAWRTKLCSGKTKRGTQCKRVVKGRRKYCHQHKRIK